MIRGGKAILKKLLIIALISTFILGGCTEKTDNVVKGNSQNQSISQESENENKEENKITKEDEEEIVLQYNEIIKNEKPYVAMEYIDKNIEKVSEENAGAMILGLENIQRDYTYEYSSALFENDRANQLHNTFGFEFDKEKIDTIEDSDLKELITEIINGGYKLVVLEGDFYPIQNYSLLKKYIPYLSNDMKDYIEIYATESEKLSFKDAHLAISWDELADRALKTESYLLKYKDVPEIKEVGNLYIGYIRPYIHPMNDYSEPNKINDEVINAYKRVVDEHEGTTTAQITKELLDILQKNNYQVNDQIQKESDRLFKKALESLNVEDNNSY